ncbi:MULTISPECIES: hypothetical protein [unclassified Paracoccus (in: a-proteobacteria)]|uniref:hypothetical protein n=1 Tax=unclassified Paracoccus (in: a-proteobacteria) TaxID=2688777 RepID=UPI0012B22D37|nr:MULTISPECIES: hypothetical protein [unclassified Paracoccus (in: a-proteobacteria)]UXU75458.1 hypothetical protein GB879_002880 [Paracoccus sp. SMMA_5]UXU81363.1 hypothetical protein GB880_002875 [Paracoccus sp. SMMA_5_TC]
MQRRAFLALAAPAVLVACGADNRWASDEAVRRARYVSDEPPSITLFTVIGIPRGEGGHSALMVNASQRVIYDPAGSWEHPAIPERRDVLYGITPNFKNFYIDYHARETYWVAEDTIQVPMAVAEAALRAVEAQGPSNKGFCAVNTGKALRRVPGFEGAPTGFSPIRLREWFLTLPGVVSKKHMDGDPANNHNVLLRQKSGVVRGYDQNGQLQPIR